MATSKEQAWRERLRSIVQRQKDDRATGLFDLKDSKTAHSMGWWTKLTGRRNDGTTWRMVVHRHVQWDKEMMEWSVLWDETMVRVLGHVWDIGALARSLRKENVFGQILSNRYIADVPWHCTRLPMSHRHHTRSAMWHQHRTRSLMLMSHCRSKPLYGFHRCDCLSEKAFSEISKKKLFKRCGTLFKCLSLKKSIPGTEIMARGVSSWCHILWSLTRNILLSTCKMTWKKHVLLCKMSPTSHFFLLRKVNKSNQINLFTVVVKKHVLREKFSPPSHFFLFEKGEIKIIIISVQVLWRNTSGKLLLWIPRKRGHLVPQDFQKKKFFFFQLTHSLALWLVRRFVDHRTQTTDQQNYRISRGIRTAGA